MENMDRNPAELIELAKKGDREAFAELYKYYYLPVYRYIYIRLRNKEEAEDLTQTVFLKFYEKISGFSYRGVDPLAYLFTIGRNALIDYFRKSSAEKRKVLEGDLEEIEDETGRFAEKREKRDLVESALGELTGDQREIITLKFLSELENSEITKVTGKSEEAVRQLQCRALKILRQYFKDNNLFK